jgi:hypothetical protein
MGMSFSGASGDGEPLQYAAKADGARREMNSSNISRIFSRKVKYRGPCKLRTKRRVFETCA